jgi:hypothetical protein
MHEPSGDTWTSNRRVDAARIDRLLARFPEAFHGSGRRAFSRVKTSPMISATRENSSMNGDLDGEI